MRFSIWKPEYLTMVVHRAFEFRSQIQISLFECNMIGYSLTGEVVRYHQLSQTHLYLD